MPLPFFEPAAGRLARPDSTPPGPNAANGGLADLAQHLGTGDLGGLESLGIATDDLEDVSLFRDREGSLAPSDLDLGGLAIPHLGRVPSMSWIKNENWGEWGRPAPAMLALIGRRTKLARLALLPGDTPRVMGTGAAAGPAAAVGGADREAMLASGGAAAAFRRSPEVVSVPGRPAGPPHPLMLLTGANGASSNNLAAAGMACPGEPCLGFGSPIATPVAAAAAPLAAPALL